MKATIILPTTGDRGGILKFSVGSVLNQTERDWELFIVGDGLDVESATTAQEIADGDERIHLFPYDKGASRGEIYRHEILMERAQGDVVCYLCDRDLYLRNHVSVMHSLLESYDFGHSLPTVACQFNGMVMNKGVLNQKADLQREFSKRSSASFGLSIAAHRLASYKQLPYGWRETPRGVPTDYYMWEQFFEQPGLRFGIAYEPTVVYMPRQGHPGLPTADRIVESEAYFDAYCGEEGLEAFKHDLYRDTFQALTAGRFKKLMRKQRRKKWLRLGF